MMIFANLLFPISGINGQWNCYPFQDQLAQFQLGQSQENLVRTKKKKRKILSNESMRSSEVLERCCVAPTAYVRGKCSKVSSTWRAERDRPRKLCVVVVVMYICDICLSHSNSFIGAKSEAALQWFQFKNGGFGETRQHWWWCWWWWWWRQEETWMFTKCSRCESCLSGKIKQTSEDRTWRSWNSQDNRNLQRSITDQQVTWRRLNIARL